MLLRAFGNLNIKFNLTRVRPKKLHIETSSKTLREPSVDTYHIIGHSRFLSKWEDKGIFNLKMFPW